MSRSLLWVIGAVTLKAIDCIALAAKGFGHERLRQEQGLAFAVRRCLADYRGAARLDDQLVVETRLTALGGASLDLEQTVCRDGEKLVRMDVKVACLGPGLRPARLPQPLRAALARMMQPFEMKSSDAT